MIVAMPLAIRPRTETPEVCLPGANRETIEGLEFRINRSDVYPRIGFTVWLRIADNEYTGSICHTRESGYPGAKMRRRKSGPVVSAERLRLPSDVASWIPAFAGMTCCCGEPDFIK